MRLVRGWEKRYAPGATGGLRLSKARLYRTAEEEGGLGDSREGEVRIGLQGDATSTWEPIEDFPLRLTNEAEEQSDAKVAEHIRELLAMELDDPEIAMESQGPGMWRIRQNVKREDSELVNPFVLCLSREPTTRSDWERLRAALPDMYDCWTVTEDVDSLNFEIECGIKRWMAQNKITEHTITRCRGWVEYSYDTIPPCGGIGEEEQVTRWFRKRREYIDQAEYRLAWNLSSPQYEEFPNTIDIELTKTGLSLFRPYYPPCARP